MIINRSELVKKLSTGSVEMSLIGKNLYPLIEKWMLKNDVTIIGGMLVRVC